MKQLKNIDTIIRNYRRKMYCDKRTIFFNYFFVFPFEIYLNFGLNYSYSYAYSISTNNDHQFPSYFNSLHNFLNYLTFF